MNHNSLTTISSKLLSKYYDIWHCITRKPIALRCPKYIWEDLEKVRWYKHQLQETLWVSCLVIADQTHSDIALEVTVNNSDENFSCDAIYTRERDIALFVLASDCVPILFYDRKLQIIGAIHAWWRGLQKWIILKTFWEISRKYDSRAGDLQVFIGPHIWQPCYEVGEEVASEFREKHSECILENSQEREKYFLDTWAIAMKQILSLWIDSSQIEYSDLCTYGEEEILHSYRRKTHTWDENYGNNGFGIWLR